MSTHSKLLILSFFTGCLLPFSALALDLPTFFGSSVDSGGTFTFDPGSTCPFDGSTSLWAKVLATSSDSYLFNFTPDFSCSGYPYAIGLLGYWYNTPHAGDLFQVGGDSARSEIFQYTGSFFAPVTSGATQIFSVHPYDNEVIASTTPVHVGFTAYVATGDVGSDIKQNLQQINTVLSLFTNAGSVTLASSTITATSTGYYTADENVGRLSIGTYSYRVELQNCFKPFGIVTPICSPVLDSRGAVVATSTYFAIDANSLVGESWSNADRVLERLVTSQASGTTTPLVESGCSPGSFSVTKCLYGLFVPSPNDVSNLFAQLHDRFLSVVPLGYVTRFVSVLYGTTTAEPPPLTYTFGSSTPAELRGGTISIQLWDNIDKLTQAKSDDGQDKTIWDIVDPYFQMVVAFAVLLIILNDLMGITVRRSHGEHKSKTQ